MTDKHDHAEDHRTTRERNQERADEANQAEATRVASLQPSDTPASGAAPVEPHTEMFPHQPHGQAGQPQNRPAHEGHQGVTPIQPDEQSLTEAISPTEAITHGEPNRTVGTEYSNQERHGGTGGKRSERRDEGKVAKDKSGETEGEARGHTDHANAPEAQDKGSKDHGLTTEKRQDSKR